jgi:hypothetical protein
MRATRSSIAIAACMILPGLVGHVLAQTATFRQCGAIDNNTGKVVPNQTCPGCVGNCWTNNMQMYKVCDVKGNTCANNRSVFCSGEQRAGIPPNASNCNGMQVGTCQIPETGCR